MEEVKDFTLGSQKLDGCADPYVLGKALKVDLRGYWRYRVGDHRIICGLRDKELVILDLKIGHRREIYG